jgi:adenosine deaminase
MQHSHQTDMELIDAIKVFPKAEHHVHLLGSIKPATLMKAITDTGVDSPLPETYTILDINALD